MAVRKEYNQSWNPFWMNMPESELPIAGEDQLGGVKVGDGLDIEEDGTLNAEGGELPIASAETLGGIKVGDGLEIEQDGTLNVGVDPYELPIASANTLGGVKIGSGLNINAAGVLSAAGGDVMAIKGDNSTLSKILQNCVAALPNGGVVQVFIPRLVYTLKSTDVIQYGCTAPTDGSTECKATLKVYTISNGKWVETILNQWSNISIDTSKFVTNGGYAVALFSKIVQGAEIVLTNCVLRVNVNSGATTPAMWALYTNGDVFARSVSGTGDGIYAMKTNLAYPTAVSSNGLLTGVREVPYKQYLLRHNGGMVTERSSFYSGAFMAGSTEMTGTSRYGGYLYKASWGNQYNGCVDDILDIAKYTGASQWVGGFNGSHNGILYTYDTQDQATYADFEGVDLQPAIEEWTLPNGYDSTLVCVASPQ